MTVLKSLLSPIYLEDKEVRKVIELMFFSYRDFTSGPDKILENLNFGRAHHRVIYFVGKQEKITIKDILDILQITKQSLSRVLNQLVNEKYIDVTIGIDKRTKNLTLTKKGADLEKQLSTIQINKIKSLIKDSDEKEVNSFKIMLYKMIDKRNQIKFDEINN